MHVLGRVVHSLSCGSCAVCRADARRPAGLDRPSRVPTADVSCDDCRVRRATRRER